MGEFLATALAYYEPGTVRLEITALIAEHDQVVMQWTSRARTRRRPTVRERLHRRVHRPRREDLLRPRVHGHAVRQHRVRRRRRTRTCHRRREVTVRIFVAGASGVIGVRLVPLLVAAGHDVAGMTRSPAKLDRL